MSLFRPARRSAPEARGFTVGNVGSGWSATGAMDQALRLVPLYSAATLIVDALSTVPVTAYLDERPGRIPTPVQPEIVVSPGLGVRRDAWIGQAMMSLLLRGNAFGLVAATGFAGLPTKVVWIHPDQVTVDESGVMPEYMVGGRHVPREMVVHIPGHVLPGSCVGLSPLGLFRTQMQTGMRVDAAAGDWYGQAANPRGVLSQVNRPLTPDEIEAAKERYAASVKSGDVLVMGNDWKWQSLTVSPADAQFVDAAQMTANQVAAIYHVPPDEIGGTTGSSLTYSTVELNGVKFNRRAVLPWSSRLQAAWSEMLPNDDFVEFDLSAAAQPDLQTRANIFGTLFRAGVEPASAAKTAGLPDLIFTGAVPITLRQPETEAAGLEDK